MIMSWRKAARYGPYRRRSAMATYAKRVALSAGVCGGLVIASPLYMTTARAEPWCVPDFHQPCSVLPAPVPPTPALPKVEWTSNVFPTLEAVAGDRTLWNPTDPENGDPGGAEVTGGYSVLGQQLAALGFTPPEISVILATPLQQRLVSWGASPQEIRTILATPVAVALLSVPGLHLIPTAAIPDGICDELVVGSSVHHTARRAVGVSLISCSKSALMSDQFFWQNIGNATVFDTSAGSCSDPTTLCIDSSDTTGGHRGHRTFFWCFGITTQDNEAASGCDYPLGGGINYRTGRGM